MFEKSASISENGGGIEAAWRVTPSAEKKRNENISVAYRKTISEAINEINLEIIIIK